MKNVLSAAATSAGSNSSLRDRLRNYGEIARETGPPAAARAVARACATNSAAILIPCYRWGLERKNALLALERKRQEP